ncbi:MAG: hypothetical protein RIC87_01650 [Kiloniellales bacterium]
MRNQPTEDQGHTAGQAAPHGRLTRLLNRLRGKKTRQTKAKQPLAVAHLYGLPRPGAV